MKIKVVWFLVILLTSGCAINQGYQGTFTNKVVATDDAIKIQVFNPPSPTSPTKVVLTNYNLFPYIVRVQTFNSSAKTEVIGEAIATIQSHQSLGLDIPPFSGKTYAQQVFVNASWKYGDSSYKKNNEGYMIPFPRGIEARVCQYSNGPITTHQRNPDSIDFCVPLGTPILAAKSGRVTEAIDTNTEGGNDPSFTKKSNYVMIAHDDLSIARYDHMAPNSVKVKPGDYVAQGDSIGSVGMTGYTSGPHLHLEAWYTDNLFITQYLAPAFSTPSKKPILLSYQAIVGQDGVVSTKIISRADQLARLKAAAGAEGGKTITSYADSVRRKVKPFIVFNPETLVGNPAVVIEVELAPDGAITSKKISTSSGDSNWDNAVLLALDYAKSLPKDDNGLIPMRQMKLTFRPKDEEPNLPYVIRLAAFDNIEISNEWFNKIKQLNIPVYQLNRQLDGKSIFVLRAGPFNYLAIAQDSLKKINSIGLKGEIIQVTPEAKVSPETDKATAQNNEKPIQTDIGKLVVTYQPNADPYYPAFSKRAGEQGAVVVRLIINESGEVYEVALLQSSTFQRLDRAAIEIGRRYRFKPFLVNGAPVKISTNLLIKFNLKDDKAPASVTTKDPAIKNGGQSFLPASPKPAAENLTQSTKPTLPISPQRVDISDLKAVFEPSLETHFSEIFLGETSVTFVLVDIQINEQGSVTSANTLNSSDYRIKERAELMARQYRFKPYLVNGSPSKISSILKIELKKNSALADRKIIEPPKAKIAPQQSAPPQKIQPTKEGANQIKPAEKIPDVDPVGKFTNQVKEFLKPSTPVAKSQPTEPAKQKQSIAKPNIGTPASRLSALKEMLDNGLITEKDYNTKKQEILNSM